MEAILFSEFPKPLVDKVRQKLLRKEVKVTRVLPVCVDERRIRSAIAEAQWILVMHEMGSHPKINTIRKLAAENQKRCTFLSRKESSWQLDPPRDDFAVPSEKLDDFLSEYRRLMEANVRQQDMLPHLAQYWREGRRLYRVQQLGVALYQIRRNGRGPAWFAPWFDSINGKAEKPQLRLVSPPPETREEEQPAAEETAAQPGAQDSEAHVEIQEVEVAPSNADDVAFLANEYARENGELRKRIEELQSELQRAKLKPLEDSLVDLAQTAAAIHRLTVRKLLPMQEAYDQLIRLCGIQTEEER